MLEFYADMGVSVGTGGRFDWQRSGNQVLGLVADRLHVQEFKFERHDQYVAVSNVNVGLWLQQTVYSLEDALTLAGDYARRFSTAPGPRTSYGLTVAQQELFMMGWKLVVHAESITSSAKW